MNINDERNNSQDRNVRDHNKITQTDPEIVFSLWIVSSLFQVSKTSFQFI